MILSGGENFFCISIAAALHSSSFFKNLSPVIKVMLFFVAVSSGAIPLIIIFLLSSGISIPISSASSESFTSMFPPFSENSIRIVISFQGCSSNYSIIGWT